MLPPLTLATIVIEAETLEASEAKDTVGLFPEPAASSSASRTAEDKSDFGRQVVTRQSLSSKKHNNFVSGTALPNSETTRPTTALLAWFCSSFVDFTTIFSGIFLLSTIRSASPDQPLR